jgi:hypothetical protein
VLVLRSAVVVADALGIWLRLALAVAAALTAVVASELFARLVRQAQQLGSGPE